MTNFIAINILSRHFDYTQAQCGQCWSEFRLERAEEVVYTNKNRPHPAINSHIVCPNCGKISYVFCWMDFDNIPYMR